VGETTAPQDGSLADLAEGRDLTALGPDAVGDLAGGGDLATILDTPATNVDAPGPGGGDAEEDVPVDLPPQDVGQDQPAAGAEPPATDGPSAGKLDSGGVGDSRDSGKADGTDDVPPPALDLGADGVDGRDAMALLDASFVNPDSPPDVAPDRPDTAVSSPDAPDSNVTLDSNTARDTQDGKANDGGGPCCGCLCRDPSWSCSQDTCVDSSGHALTLAAEAGFFELAGASYVSENETRTSPTHRIWYSFQPASTSPESKPLAVFFNGGPGSSTSVYLFSLNTAPYTLDPAFTGTAKIATNANSWAQFANLLYIDAPGTGFSYPMALANGSKPSVGIDLDRDAGAFVRVVVRFLARHPRLQANPVIIVGESYGGTRATLMLDHILTYQSLTGSTAAYRDSDLYNDLVAHFAAVWPQDNPQAIPAAKIATQFGWQVLIQPVVAGDAQWNRQTHDESVCLSSAYDGYQCNQPSGWSDQLATTVGQNLTTIATLRQALGVNPTTIDWLHASARTTAYGRSSGRISAPEMTTTFGALTSDDSYLVVLNGAVNSPYAGTARTWHDSAIGGNFLTDLGYVKTFITNAKYDMVVWTPALAPGLASFTSSVASTVIDSAPRTGIARPGWIKVTYLQGVVPAPTTREIRFPTYSNAGHMVSARDSANLLADVMQWYSSSSAHAQLVADGTPVVPPPVPKVPRTAPAVGKPVLYLGP
jgi:hypothetical protein